MWGCSVSVALGHNGGPGLDEWVDYRHALMVAIRDDASLPPRARMLGVMVCTYMDQDGTGARPSARLLANVTGYGVNTISKIMALVEEAGWMHIKRGSRKVGTTYETAQSYEDAIATYVKGARGRYANSVTNETAALSPSVSDKTSDHTTTEGDKRGPLSPHVSDKKKVKSGFVTDGVDVLSPDATLLSPTATVLSPPESDRRIEDINNISPLTPLGRKSDMPAHVKPLTPENLYGDAYKPEGVWLDENGTPHIANGFRASWVKLYADAGLTEDVLDLDVLGLNVQPNSKLPVRRKMEQHLSTRLRKAKAKPKSDYDQKCEAMADAMRKLMAD